ncbi:hypothetical protein [Acaryochloris marina]|uniref:Uncharacterized protein n=1 Tax=Acaryochloris marina (strain MBIC 11017) TaxID=329726 RepID=B0CDS3_ACAM1|nr:hypothetical protein [Acaryochloris marina]ABW29275.1 hypothetical protein AM1_4296 [Acaryochloris marina MBIC11017]BDM78193.1 hypothetical protein AM10699_10630 [Acaryochloris marina MBIC10699]
MDPMMLILTALVTGAAKVAGDAAPDAYKGLKALIQKKVVGKPEAEMALAKYEEKPDVWEEPLKDALAESGIDKDEEILKAAQELLEQLQPGKTVSGTINIGQGAKGNIGQNVIGSKIGIIK